MSDRDILLWLDIETTGLDPSGDLVLEVGMRATDWELQPLDEGCHVVLQCPRSIRQLDTLAVHMHNANHLLAECTDLRIARPDGYATRLLRRYVQEQLFASMASGGRVLLAGSSVHFDVRFLHAQFPGVLLGVDHRHIDVSVLDELARHDNPDVWDGRPPKLTNHRVLNCIKDSVALFAYYRSHLGLDSPREDHVDDLIDQLHQLAYQARSQARVYEQQEDPRAMQCFAASHCIVDALQLLKPEEVPE